MSKWTFSALVCWEASLDNVGTSAQKLSAGGKAITSHGYGAIPSPS
jgi:hypothetical protein